MPKASDEQASVVVPEENKIGNKPSMMTGNENMLSSKDNSIRNSLGPHSNQQHRT